MSATPMCPKCNKDGSNINNTGGQYSGEMLTYHTCTLCNLQGVTHYKGPPRIAIWFCRADSYLADKYLKELDRWRKSAIKKEELDDTPWTDYILNTKVTIPSPPKELHTQILFGGVWVKIRSV